MDRKKIKTVQKVVITEYIINVNFLIEMADSNGKIDAEATKTVQHSYEKWSDLPPKAKKFITNRQTGE